MTARKPNHLKALSGTIQPCRSQTGAMVLDEAPLDECPPAPPWMPNAFAVTEWDRLAPILQVNKLLTSSTLQPLGILCACYGKIVQTYAAGSQPTSSDLAQYRGLASEFGLTPAAQAKMRPADPGKPRNRFGRFGKKPDA